MDKKLMAVEFDGITQEVIERELTANEIADLKKLSDESLAQKQEKETNRLSALSKLEAIGLTEEEIAAL